MAAESASASAPAPPRRPGSGNRLDASIVKLRERQLLMKQEQASDGENGEASPLHPEVILTEVGGSESGEAAAAAARKSFNDSLHDVKVRTSFA